MTAPWSAPISRRTMLRGSLGVGATLLAGCSSAVDHLGAGKGTRELTVGNASDFGPLTILRAGTNEGFLSLMFDSLAVLDTHTGARLPSVARSWRYNADKTELTVDLRDDVRYHTGRLLAPKDVIFSVSAVKDPTAGAQVGGSAALIKRIVVTGPHQLRFVLERPLSCFLDLLVMMPLVDSETYKQLASGSRVVGTGPFVFDEWVPGQSVTMTANPHYWAGAPLVRRIDERIYGSEQALVLAMRAGEVDLAFNLTPRQASLLADGGQFPTVSTGRFYSEYYVGANVAAKPFDNLIARQAVAYALDRPRIVAQAFASFGTVSTQTFPTSLPGVDPALDHYYRYDPDKARALFKQAGSPSNTIPIECAANPVSQAILNIVQYNLSSVGFTVAPKAVQMTEFQTDQVGGRIKGLFIAPLAQLDLNIGFILLGNAPLKIGKNTSNVTAPEYSKLGNRLIHAATEAEVAAATRAYTRYVVEQAFHLTIGHVPLTSARTPRLSGVSATAGLNVDLSRARLSAA